MLNYTLKVNESLKTLDIELMNTNVFSDDVALKLLTELTKHDLENYQIHCDLSRVNRIDSTSIGLLIHIYQKIESTRSSMTVLASQAIKPAFELSRLADLFKVNYVSNAMHNRNQPLSA